MSTPHASPSPSGDDWNRSTSDNPFAPRPTVIESIDDPVDGIVLEDPIVAASIVTASVVVPTKVVAANALRQYAVPKQFGLLAILGITTAIAVLFGGLRWYGAPPEVFMFLGGQTVVVCLAQMFFGDVPRAISSITGMILAPLFMVAAVVVNRSMPIGAFACLLVITIPAGAILGYMTGTCAAGVFLLIDVAEKRIEDYLKSRAAKSPTPAA